ncbi:HlyD family type I secretion periplasmic adaptor subunit [Desulfonatronum thiodismutans]|uniref:HlyD family type I secretion periplasmic adaptor subunit n=1 Tax=Desulfonatronum thiodismutans TaxID=159290 RepID=UPI0004ABDB21|nr:HlyD family type I secretion periplasmic adaptor subunit [Desulfonatronum thiodismutans]
MKTNQKADPGKATQSSPKLGVRESRLLSEAEQIEERLIPGYVKPLLTLIFLMVLLFLAWASTAKLTEVARAPGEIIPIGQTKIVQHLDGGEIAEIHVDEGDLVERGQTLLLMDGSQASADLQQMEARWMALSLRAERLLAFAENRVPEFVPSRLPAAFRLEGDEQTTEYTILTTPHMHLIHDQLEIYHKQVAVRESSLAVITSQVEQARQRLIQLEKALASARDHQKHVAELLDMREELGRQQLITRTELVETRRAKVTADGEVERIEEEIIFIDETLTEASIRLEDAANQFRRDALSERGVVRAELAEVEETLQRLRARVSRLEVRSPERGLIQDLQVLTTGQVVQPGAVLMRIVPTDVPLEAEVRIAPRDIGHIKIGQNVRIRVTSYDYRRFGNTEGVLRRISATNVVTPGGDPFFRGWIELTRPYVGTDPTRFQILPGMSVEAEIITGEKTFLGYLFTPVTDIIDRSFGER